MPSIYGLPYLVLTPHCLVSTGGDLNFLGTRNLVLILGYTPKTAKLADQLQQAEAQTDDLNECRTVAHRTVAHRTVGGQMSYFSFAWWATVQWATVRWATVRWVTVRWATVRTPDLNTYGIYQLVPKYGHLGAFWPGLQSSWTKYP